MTIKAHHRSCINCRSLGYEDDGGEPEYSVSWPVCDMVDRYQYLKSFPFKKRMPCFRYNLNVDEYKSWVTESYAGGVWIDRDLDRLLVLESQGKVYR